MFRPDLPPQLTVLGLAGIMPQAACIVAVLAVPGGRWFALAAGCCYAAAILSFLGGLWWMAVLIDPRRSAIGYLAAVVPSLIGWAAMLPWCFGWPWPGPSLVMLGACLLASPLIDRALPATAALPPGWLRLRILMASGLGLTTLALALI